MGEDCETQALPLCECLYMPARLALPICEYIYTAARLALPLCEYIYTAARLALPLCEYIYTSARLEGKQASLPRPYVRASPQPYCMYWLPLDVGGRESAYPSVMA